MADITITIQAASDAYMTTSNTAGGVALGEGDARKVYGLPNISSEGLTDPDADPPTTAKIDWLLSPRWDTIQPHQWQGPQFFISSGEVTPFQLSSNAKSDPTTTAFQLRCDTITHEFTDNVSISPIPAFDISPGQHDNAGTPGQLNMIVLALGMRTEIIKLSGVLVDRGLVTADNPRRQILLNIARMQHYKTGRGGQGGNDPRKWGGLHSSILNPRSYPCLKIFEARQDYPIYSDSTGTEPSGDSRQYRGIIKDLSFRMEGGRPDHWFWNMTFNVISNEHSPLPERNIPWISSINRTRLVDANDGDGDEVETGEDGYFEIRCSDNLIVTNPDGTETIEFQDGNIVYLSNTQSVPTLNGNWKITGVNLDNRTFIIETAHNNNHGEIGIIMQSANNAGTVDELKWNEADADLSDGNKGHVAAFDNQYGLDVKTKA